ncbi:MAG: DEAD/DEAH box helicase [Bacteroidales bacterium]|jgi:SNF2 family DNA or RNA helicase|nr:DEAD/DEAH box helicase [Bacteroidales bacterium]
METKFAIILQRHRLLGWILSPFELTRKTDKDFYELAEYILPEMITKDTPETKKKLIKLIAEYDEKKLFHKFSKRKKDTQKNFLEKIDQNYFKEEIRPYIEKNMAECVFLIKEHSIPFYLEENETNLHPEDELFFQKQEPKVLFSFAKTQSELEYSLSIIEYEKPLNLLDKKPILISNIPGILAINHTIYMFSSIDCKKLLPFFVKKQITIPEKFVQQYYDTFVLNSIKNYTVHTQGFEINDVFPQPKLEGKIVRDIQNHACIKISFNYEEWKISDLEQEKEYYVRYVNIENTPQYTRIYRDLNFEKTCHDLLCSHNLTYNKGFWRLKEYNSDGYYETLQWIQNNKTILDSIDLNIFDESMEMQVQNYKAEISISIASESIDWFDVHAIVNFGPYKVPFKKLRKNILNQDPRVLLPDNKIGIIPYEWFTRYRDLFLYSVKNEKEDVFSLRSIHYKTIQHLPVKFKDEIKTRFLHIDTNGAKKNNVPIEIKATLRPYQIEGYRWLYFLYANNFGGCLADDMGLGKTLQAITLLYKVISLQKAQDDNRASLIVCPASIIYNWHNEFEKFAPDLKVFKYIGNERDKNFDYFSNYDIIITTYGLLRNDIENFIKYSFLYVVLDESQIIKNPRSKIYNSVLQLDSSHRLVLTGTPIENSLIDLWAQMNFLNRNMLGSIHSFKDHFLKVPDHIRPQVEQQLQRTVSPFIFRREKQAVAQDLPPLTEQIRVCKMTDSQTKIYESEKSQVRNLIYETIENNTFQKSTINVLRALMRLRQIANHPKLTEDYSDEDVDSGKFNETIRVLENLIHHHKVLIFSSFVQHLQLFESYFEKNNISYTQLTGSTTNREKVINKFQKDDDCKVFLISIKAGGVGLNLTEADYVFILDPWWNPAIENQAVSRAHRIGQKNKVHVYRFISENTIEEKIKRLQERKAALANNIIISSEKSIPFSEEEVSFLVE